MRDTALGSIPVFYNYCSPAGPPSRALAPPEGAFRSGSCTFLPGSKGSRPLWHRPQHLRMRLHPPGRRSAPPYLKPWGAPRAGLRGGRGQRASVGARTGLVGFGEKEEEKVGAASAETKPRPGDGREDWARGSVVSRSVEGTRASLPRNRSAAGRAASFSLGFPGPATHGSLLLGQAAARPPLPCGSGPK